MDAEQPNAPDAPDVTPAVPEARVPESDVAE